MQSIEYKRRWGSIVRVMEGVCIFNDGIVGVPGVMDRRDRRDGITQI